MTDISPVVLVVEDEAQMRTFVRIALGWVTAVCTAIMLEVKPIARVMSRARPDPDPKACTRVVATGLASLPETDAAMTGIASTMPSEATMTSTPPTTSERMTALGRTLRDSWTSSAMEAEASKPMNE